MIHCQLSEMRALKSSFLVASADSNSIDMLDLEHGKLYPFIRDSELLHHPDAMAYHPRSGNLLVSSGTDITNSAVFEFDPRTGAFLKRFDERKSPLSL